MLQKLPPDELADIAGADDDRVLDVVDVAPAVRARDRSARGDKTRSPSAQKSSSFGGLGCATFVMYANAKKSQAQTVTM